MQLRQSKCTTYDDVAFNLPIVAFTLSGDQILYEGHAYPWFFIAAEKRGFCAETPALPFPQGFTMSELAVAEHAFRHSFGSAQRGSLDGFTPLTL